VSAELRPYRFLSLYHAGEVTAGEIHDYIDAWHLGNAPVSLHVYLGLTWAEYRTWLHDGWLPTVEEHAVERVDAVWVPGEDDDDGEILRVHSPVNCRPPCPIHWPSDHPLVRSPMRWDTRGFLTRRCSHGQEHPDPDDQQVRLHEELREHQCDSCCTAQIIDGEVCATPVAELLQAEQGVVRRPR